MVEETLNALNPWWNREYDHPGIERARYTDHIDRALSLQKTAILHGLRRTGKSTIIKQHIHKMIPTIGANRLCYALLDHPKLRSMSIIDLVGIFRRMMKISTRERHIIYLDEVHNREGFEWELKALNDMDDGIQMVAAGSSSLVIRHRSSAMTGRYMKIKVEPLDFSEFLQFKKMELDLSEESF